MNLSEAKAYLANSWVLHPDYRLDANPQHNLYEPVNIRLTFAHLKHGGEKRENNS